MARHHVWFAAEVATPFVGPEALACNPSRYDTHACDVDSDCDSGNACLGDATSRGACPWAQLCSSDEAQAGVDGQVTGNYPT